MLEIRVIIVRQPKRPSTFFHDRDRGADRVIEGHVEVRWSHGKFGGAPEAKIYLDTPHHDVAGYEPLTVDT